MTTHQLFNALTQTVMAMKHKLGVKGEKICAKELAAIQVKLDSLKQAVRGDSAKAAQHEVKLLKDLIGSIEKMIAEIDGELHDIEREIDEVAYERGGHHPRTEERIHKRHIKSTLQALIDRIRVDLPYI